MFKIGDKIRDINSDKRYTVMPNITMPSDEISLKYANSKSYFELVQDTFVLPEKWFVRTTPETNKILCDWRGGGHRGTSKLGYGESVLRSDRFWEYEKSVPIDYQEITFEQFNTYILKETQMNKKIIGYKCPKVFTAYRNSQIGEVYKKSILNSNMYTGSLCSLNLPSELVETWEPVYQEEEIKLGNHIVSFSSKGAKVGCTIYSKTQLEEALRTMNLPNIKKSGWVLEFEDGTEVTREDIQLMLNKLK